MRRASRTLLAALWGVMDNDPVVGKSTRRPCLVLVVARTRSIGSFLSQ
jgi:hypothetical protein